LNQKKSFNAIDNTLLILWSIGSFVAILLVITIFRIGLHNIKDIAPLIGAFAILVSAGIASMSVMKSIHTTQQNEKQKAENEKERKRIFTLNVMKTIQVTLGTFSKKASMNSAGYAFVPNYDSQFDFESDIQIVGKLINSIFCESILPYITNKEQEIISNFYIEYNRFLATKNEAEQNYPMVQANVTSTQTKLLEYSKLFSDFAQSYIDLNTKP